MPPVDSGKCRYKFQWYPRVLTTDASTGEEVESFPSSSEEYWGNLSEVRPWEKIASGKTEVEVAIDLLGNPAIREWDRLKDKETNDIFLIDGITEDRPSKTLHIIAHRYKGV